MSTQPLNRLQIAWRACACNDAKSRRATERRVGRVEHRRIRDVERLRAKLSLDPFAHGATQRNGAAEVAESELRGDGESGSVEPTVESLIEGQIGLRVDAGGIGSHVIGPDDAVVVRLRDRKRIPRLHHTHDIERPATDGQIRQTVIGQK